MSPSFDHAPSKRRQKKQLTKHRKQAEAYVTNEQYEEPLEHIISNDINNQTKDIINIEKLTRDIIKIGKSCIDLGMKEVVISSILLKKNIALPRLIRQVNDSLREQCVLNGFGFIFNDNILKTHLWKDGIYLEDLGPNILAGNFVDFLNSYILSKPSEYPWLYTDKNLKGFYLQW